MAQVSSAAFFVVKNNRTRMKASIPWKSYHPLSFFPSSQAHSSSFFSVFVEQAIWRKGLKKRVREIHRRVWTECYQTRRCYRLDAALLQPPTPFSVGDVKRWWGAWVREGREEKRREEKRREGSLLRRRCLYYLPTLERWLQSASRDNDRS